MKNIIFYHIEQNLWEESQGYLEINLKCAVKFNPDMQVWLIGDKDPLVEGVRWIDYRTLEDERIDMFKKIYIHLSPNPPLFEMNSILRYFYIWSFCEANNITEFITPDTDVMILTDLSKFKFDCQIATHIDKGFAKKFDVDSYAICNHFLWCYNSDFLYGFIESVMNQYRLKDKSYIYTIYKKMKEKGEVAGISDMVHWGFYCFYNELAFCNLRGYKEYDNFFEESVSGSESFEMENGLKKIYFKNSFDENNNPIFYVLRNKENIIVQQNIIHWSGANKQYVQKFYDKYLYGKV